MSLDNNFSKYAFVSMDFGRADIKKTIAWPSERSVSVNKETSGNGIKKR